MKLKIGLLYGLVFCTSLFLWGCHGGTSGPAPTCSGAVASPSAGYVQFGAVNANGCGVVLPAGFTPGYYANSFQEAQQCAQKDAQANGLTLVPQLCNYKYDFTANQGTNASNYDFGPYASDSKSNAEKCANLDVYLKGWTPYGKVSVTQLSGTCN